MQVMDTFTAELNALNNIAEAKTAEVLRERLAERYPEIHKDLARVIIVGAADEGLRFYGLCRKYGIAIDAIVDDRLAGQKIEADLTVRDMDSLLSSDREIPVIIASHRVLKAKQKLAAQGFKTVVPFALLQVLYPDLFEPHMFYTNWLESLVEGYDDIVKLAQLLEDEKSLAVLDAILKYRLTLDPFELDPVIDWDMYGFEHFNYGAHEVYIDGGAFDGDTVRSFIKRVDNNFDKVYAFEPDTNTYEKLKFNFVNEAKVYPINKGLYSHTTTLHFDNAGTRASIFCESGEGLQLPVTSIDEVLEGSRVTLIKMNIEGAEAPALNGARQSITKYQPKLAISIYHFPSDLWSIPLLVKQMKPEYKLYLRQHDGGTIEGVLYAK